MTSSERGGVLIDDTGASLDACSDFGRIVLGPSLAPLRDECLRVASVLGWSVIRHADFSEWVVEVLDEKPGAAYVILDPLLKLPSRLISYQLRMTRQATANGPRLTHPSVSLPEDIRGREVVVVDDVALSGGTLTVAIDTIHAAAGRVQAVVTAAGTTAAQARLTAPYDVSCRQMIRCSQAIHLRDAFSCLPHSGRPVDTEPPIRTVSRLLERRMPAQCFRGSVWDHFSADAGCTRAFLRSRTLQLHALAGLLGREPIVSDITTLGNDTPLTVLPRQTATAATPLRALFER